MSDLFLAFLLALCLVASSCTSHLTPSNLEPSNLTPSQQNNREFGSPRQNHCDDQFSQIANSDGTTTLSQLARCAEQGYAKAQYLYGNALYDGVHNGNEMQQAVYWWTKAGKQGYGDAWYRLGLLYEHGYGYDAESRADIAKSAAYYQLGAEAGSRHAQYYLGIALYRGWGIAQDQQAATQWWKEAADNGYQPAHDAYTGTVAIKWYPVQTSPIWQLFNHVNNRSKAEVFAVLTQMSRYRDDAERDLALAAQTYPEPPYFQMYLDSYRILKHLPRELNAVPTCGEFENLLRAEFNDELRSYFDSYIDTYTRESQINSALWYALQRVCAESTTTIPQ